MNAGSRRGAAALGAAALFAAALASAQQPSGAPPHFADGASVFQANCAVCHRANGAGQAGLAPPLLHYPARYVAVPEGRRQLVLTLLFGMFGDVVVDDRHFNFKMPEFSRLDDATLASVINFVAFDLSQAPDTSAPVTPGEVSRERALGLSGEAVRRHRVDVLGTAPTP